MSEALGRAQVDADRQQPVAEHRRPLDVDLRPSARLAFLDRELPVRLMPLSSVVAVMLPPRQPGTRAC
jgi:hypothetical protein